MPMLKYLNVKNEKHQTDIIHILHQNKKVENVQNEVKFLI